MTVYFIRDADRNCVKIGYTAAPPERRMAQLQTGHASKLTLLGSIPGDKASERGLHSELKQFHTNGEWFAAESRLLAIVEHLISGQLPWYHCRADKFRWDRLVSDWKQTLPSSETISFSVSDAELSQSIRDIRSFRQDERKFQSIAKTKEPQREWRAQLFAKRQALFDNPSWQAAVYALAWEGYRAIKPAPT